MSLDTKTLDQECRTYSQYLIGQAPSGYVLQKYTEFHFNPGRASVFPREPFDGMLTALSARSVTWARLADAYARHFYRGSAVRNKLVLMLALLECAPPSFRALDEPDRGGAVAVVARLSLQLARFAAFALAAVVVLSPVRILCSAGIWRPGVKHRWKESL